MVLDILYSSWYNIIWLYSSNYRNGGNDMLNITKNLEDKKLTVYLEGRLDTTTAPQLEESMKENISDVSELIMDFEKLEYISSAGLRVLLSCQKIMSKQGSMKVIHVSDLIKEIFEVTGFIDILTIE